MKKMIWIVLTIFLFCGCENKNEDVPVNIDKVEDNNSNIEEVEQYVDNNPIKIGFYDDSKKLMDSYDGKWTYHNDITWISIFPTDEENVAKSSSKSLWQQYWKDYISKGYKFGLEISYSLNNGDKINLTLLKPSDNTGFNYVELYVYDGYNATSDWFDHLDDSEINDNTVYTSVKVTSGINIDKVNSSITLKIFTYDGMDDFDESGKYRGNSYDVVIINKI